MKKELALVFVVILGIWITACNQKKGAIQNTATSEHVEIRGTRISLLPPDGFVQGGDFLGLQQAFLGASINVFEMPGPFADVTAWVNREGLLRKGIKMLYKEKFSLNGYPALFVKGE